MTFGPPPSVSKRSFADLLRVMPGICVEVLSRSNPQAEMDEERDLFFEKGAGKRARGDALIAR